MTNYYANRRLIIIIIRCLRSTRPTHHIFLVLYIWNIHICPGLIGYVSYMQISMDLFFFIHICIDSSLRDIGFISQVQT